MSEYNTQRYYWIKLTDKFMTSDTVDFLMEQKDGANYVVIYQLLCLKTVNNNGCLSREIGEVIIPYDEEKIQRDLKWFTIDTIRVAMTLYKKLGLIYEQENGILKITNFDEMVGSQSNSALKKQQQRLRLKNDKDTRVDNKVDRRVDKRVDICPPEKDIDKEKEKDIDIEIDKELHIKENKIKEIVDYLNEKISSHYSYKTQHTKLHINARLNEGFTLDDFKTVIDKKVSEWKGTEFEKYLRPETLFGTKFENYLLSNTANKSGGKPFYNNIDEDYLKQIAAIKPEE